MDGKIYVAHGGDTEKSTRLLLERADVIARIPAGADVALKPNLCVARPADSGATTHAGVIEALLGYLRDHGVRELCIMEGSWLACDTGAAFRVAGYDQLARRYGARLLDLKGDATRKVDTAVGEMRICQSALDAGYLINLPVLKGHCQTALTCALKNLKGCIPDSEKRRFHTMGLHRPIAALAKALLPALTIVDSICGDLDFEEGGTPIVTDRMLLGEDMVKLDALGARLLGLSIEDVPYIGMAEQWGVGSAELAEEDICYLGDPRGALCPRSPRGAAAKLTQGVLQKDACSACFGNLVRALHQLDEQSLLRFAPKLAIGQGMRGVDFDGLGIGRCCDGARAMVEGCPPPTNAILERLLAECGR